MSCQKTLFLDFIQIVFDVIDYFKVSLNPVRILKENAEEEKAEIARLSSFVGAIAIGDLVKSTLGPKGKNG